MRAWTTHIEPEEDPGTTSDSWRNWTITVFTIDERTDEDIIAAALTPQEDTK